MLAPGNISTQNRRETRPGASNTDAPGCVYFFSKEERYEKKNQVSERVAAAMRQRLDELCEGEAENEFDAWCRRRLYPVLAEDPFSVDGKM